LRREQCDKLATLYSAGTRRADGAASARRSGGLKRQGVCVVQRPRAGERGRNRVEDGRREKKRVLSGESVRRAGVVNEVGQAECGERVCAVTQ
jgi:hypothetical protein